MAGMLAGRNVVVTGGTGGLGRVVTARLLAEGAICHVPAHGQPDPSQTRGADAERLHITAGIDLTSQEATDRFYAALPPLWASIHLAGGFAMVGIADATEADFKRMMTMNALSAFLCARAAVRSMRAGGNGGRIVNVSARPGIEHRKGARMIPYGISKAAVAAMTEALAEELKGDRIFVNAIAPSTLDTAANRKSMPKADPDKWLSPQSAAETILMLVSPTDHEISGAVLPLYARA